MNDPQLQTYLRELKGLKGRLSSFALNPIAIFAVRRKNVFYRKARRVTAENAKKMKKKN